MCQEIKFIAFTNEVSQILLQLFITLTNSDNSSVENEKRKTSSEILIRLINNLHVSETYKLKFKIGTFRI